MIRFNISGRRMEIKEHLLDNYPTTLLGNKKTRLLNYDQQRDEYFYDRSADCFESIFYFYQSKGRIIIPLYSHLETFYDELKYFRLVNYIIEDPKCDVFILYRSFADLQETFKHDPVRLQELKTKYKKVIFIIDDDDLNDANAPPETNKCQLALYRILEKQNDSLMGKLLGFLFITTVIISIIAMCLETVYVTESNSDDENKKNKKIFFYIELITNSIFSIEWLLRLIAIRNDQKFKYLLNANNLLDLIAIIPFWIQYLIEIGLTHYGSMSFLWLGNLYVLKVVRLSRVLRIFKLGRYIKSTKMLNKMIYESSYEIQLLTMMFSMSIILFSSLMYYIEEQALGYESPFMSIPDTFWWAIISFTTVGYGNININIVYNLLF